MTQHPVDDRCELIESSIGLKDSAAIERKIRQAMAIDSLRVDRLLLASLKDDDDLRQAVFEQMPVCASCYRGVIVNMAGQLAGRTLQVYDDDVDAAVASVDAMTLADMEKPDPE